MRWEVPKIWNGGTCWILGGGPSLTEQFEIPKEIVGEVRGKRLPVSSYSPYLEALHGKHVIGVNGAFMIGDWVDMCFFGDKHWYFDHQKELGTYNGLVIGCPNFLANPNWNHLPIKYLERHTRVMGISDDPKKVCWNYNSGAAAISLAYLTGCKRVVLLGFDMQLVEGAGHWHDFYNGKNNMPFAKHLMGFEQIAADAKRLGFEIVNASPDSKITQFEKVHVKELL